jgi:hypothetical protein
VNATHALINYSEPNRRAWFGLRVALIACIEC